MLILLLALTISVWACKEGGTTTQGTANQIEDSTLVGGNNQSPPTAFPEFPLTQDSIFVPNYGDLPSSIPLTAKNGFNDSLIGLGNGVLIAKFDLGDMLLLLLKGGVYLPDTSDQPVFPENVNHENHSELYPTIWAVTYSYKVIDQVFVGTIQYEYSHEPYDRVFVKGPKKSVREYYRTFPDDQVKGKGDLSPDFDEITVSDSGKIRFVQRGS